MATIIFDSTYTRNSRLNGTAGWDEPQSGASFCAWLAGWVIMPWHAPNYVPTSTDFLRVIDAVLARKGFPTGRDVYRYGAAPYWSTTNYGPKATPHSFQVDWEIPWLANAQPSYYANIMTAISQKHPGIRLVNGVPEPLGGFDDNSLKVPNWTPTTTAINAAKAYATKNKAWIDQLWGIVIPAYFGAPSNDQGTIWWTYNRINLARQVFPGRRLIVQTSGVRNVAWYKPGGQVTQSTVTHFAGVMKSAHLDGVIVWGDRNLCAPMLKEFGIPTGSGGVTLISGTPTKVSATAESK